MNKNWKIVFVWDDCTFCISNININSIEDNYAEGSVVITTHWNEDFSQAGSIDKENSLYISSDALPDFIKALQEFL